LSAIPALGTATRYKPETYSSPLGILWSVFTHSKAQQLEFLLSNEAEYDSRANLESDMGLDHGAEVNLECDTDLDHGANMNLECDIGLDHDEMIYKRKIYSSPLNVLRSTFGHPKAQQLKFPLPNKANHSRRRMFIEKLTDKFT